MLARRQSDFANLIPGIQDMMRDHLTQAIEDYLQTIYVLTDEFGRASTTQIAERMGVKAGSVTGMIKKMAAMDPPLVEYRKHHGVVLSEYGRKAALETLRHHRLLELFLQETLGYSWDEVHCEADRLEHVMSDEVEERIAQILGDPLRDPHGDPIPTRDLQIPPQSSLRLSDLRAGQYAEVQRVEDEDPDFLRYLSSLGMIPEARLRVLDYSEFDGNLRLQVNGQGKPVVLGPRVTQQIFVEELLAL
jgi:DtxR family Mn-dependent transcriptional regulator